MRPVWRNEWKMYPRNTNSSAIGPRTPTIRKTAHAGRSSPIAAISSALLPETNCVAILIAVTAGMRVTTSSSAHRTVEILIL